MSSQKQIGRWNRFEIALAERDWPQTSPFRASEGLILDKIEKLGKPNASVGRGAKTPSKPNANDDRSELAASSAERATQEKNPNGEATFKEASSATEPRANLWTTARQAKRGKKRDISPFESGQTANSDAKEASKPFLPRRPRTFRASEPPRRFDRPNDE